MTFYYNVYACDIDKELYKETVSEVVDKIFDKDGYKIFGRHNISKHLLFDIKKGLVRNIDQLIEFPDNFNYDIYNIEKTEEVFWSELSKRVETTLNEFFENEDYTIISRDEINLSEYNCNTWEDFLKNCNEDGLILAFDEDAVFYLDYPLYSRNINSME